MAPLSVYDDRFFCDPTCLRSTYIVLFPIVFGRLTARRSVIAVARTLAPTKIDIFRSRSNVIHLRIDNDISQLSTDRPI